VFAVGCINIMTVLSEQDFLFDLVTVAHEKCIYTHETGVVWPCENGNEPSGSIKGGEFLD
jgi:hypothetical protein